MKAEKNNSIKTTAEALKKVQEVMKRIDKEREILRGEYDAVCREINNRTSGKPSIRIGKFGLGKTAEYYLTDEELATQKFKLKTAMELPYYADEEFRKHSLVYLDLITKEAQEQYADLEKRKEENYQKLLQYRQCVTKQAMEHREIGGALAMKYIAIGLGKFAKDLIYGSPHNNYLDYKNYCGKYDE